MTHDAILNLGENLPRMNPYYTVTCDGRIMAITNEQLTRTMIEKLNIGRFDAFANSDFIAIPEDVANIVLEYINKDAFKSPSSEKEKEALEIFSDAVNHIQYQATIAWFDKYQEENNCPFYDHKLD